MTANPDSALRQALENARDALEPFVQRLADFDASDERVGIHTLSDTKLRMIGAGPLTVGDLRRAREAHALITEALQRGEK